MHLRQGTPEWLAMRQSHIGASDAPIIMEESPWKTPYQLWEEKLGLAPQSLISQRMQRGLDLEDQARQKLEMMTGLFLLPEVRFHSEHKYMMASLDGIDPSGKHIAEIKCAGEKDHAIALGGNIPEKYMPQVQHQLEVCQLEVALYFSYDGSEGVIVKVFRDNEYIKKMIMKEQEFWECVQSFQAPELSLRDYESKNDSVWLNTALKWRQTNSQLKMLEEQEKTMRQALIDMAQGKSSIGAGLKLTKSLCRGNVDYSKIPELNGVPLESYRKKPIEKWRISEF